MNHWPTNDFQDLTETLQILKCGAWASYHIKLIVVSRWLIQGSHGHGKSLKILENKFSWKVLEKSWKIDKNSKVMEKLKKQKIWTDEKGPKFLKYFNVSKR